MVVGVPKEVAQQEHRVGLTPFAVSRLTGAGHSVLVERGAGEAAHFSDERYSTVGATIVYEPDEIWQRPDMICRVGAFDAAGVERVRPGAVVCGFHHLAIAPRPIIDQLAQREITLVGYEIIRDDSGQLPVLFPFSRMAGHLATDLAAYYLQTEPGGRGILMGQLPGVPPPTAVILGAGQAGRAAAAQAVGAGVHTIVLDSEIAQLRRISRDLGAGLVTVLSGPERVADYTAIADVVIGAVLNPGERAPFVVTEAMVQSMKPGAVMIDVSIDQGGCVETSRPTTLESPVFERHGVLHYCVPNMTANVPRTASRALSNSALPYLLRIAEQGIEAAAELDPGLARGVYMMRGRMRE